MKWKTKLLTLAASVMLCTVRLLPWSSVAYVAPEAEPVKTAIADKLIIQLGPDWAGVEFELTTDMGKFPGVIVVSDAGVLSMELADSSTYTLSCLNSKVKAPAAPEAVVAPSPELQPAVPTDLQTATPDEHPSAADPIIGDNETEPNSTAPADAPDTSAIDETAPAHAENDRIPTMPLVLFIGGTVLCVGGLITMRILKKRCEYDDEDEDY